MQFMLTWTLYPDTFDETLQFFSQMTPEDDREQMGDAITLVGRWHDPVGGTGVAILESDDLSAVNHFCLKWASSCELQLTPVVDDEKCRAIGRARS
ncbi:MAG: DUF3303 domain-containing protein [Longimicrobiales bacterium]|jgi:hypothetical protein